jgi:putative SOS response-associated peptidase YedK
MCGRYTLKSKGVDLQRELHLSNEPVLEARYNIAPTQAAPIVLDSNRRELVTARWGFLPRWAKDVHEGAKHINARAESLAEKRLFSEALKHSRCLVPCDGFYEWKHHGKQSTPLFIHAPENPIQTMGGLWTRWLSAQGVEVLTFSIITTAADTMMARIHSRMPLFVAPGAREAWLSASTTQGELQQLLHGGADTSFTAFEVSSYVNHAGLDDARCLEPAKAVQLDLL